MHRDPLLYLDDILEAIARIQGYTSSMDYETFSRDTKTQDAVVRNLEIIGEAATRLPESIKQAAYEIEWRKIVGLRNILTHEYFGVSLPIIWDVTVNKLKALERVCEEILNKENPELEEN